MKTIHAILFLAFTTVSYSQINSFFVAPSQTNSNYDIAQDSHMVIHNTGAPFNKLVLFMGGTGSKPKAYSAFANHAGELGFDVLNLSYINFIAAASLANDPDSLAFNKYRQEICYGTPVSKDIVVDTLNSIYNRAVNLLNYLDTTFPSQNWQKYLTNSTTLDFSQIVVAGHSQGSGHAAYFGKMHNVERVLMFSGPNDYSDIFENSANWIREPGMTSRKRQWAYLHLDDEVVPFDKQFSSLKGLNIYPHTDTTYVDNASLPFSNSQCLYTTQAPGITILKHNATLKNSAINHEVWEHMLKAPITTLINAIEKPNTVIAYPNPTSSYLYLEFSEILPKTEVSIYNSIGQMIKSKTTYNTHSMKLDLIDFQTGVYFIKTEKEIIRILKI